jgi:RNA polymerase sigma-70 factor (ECF subfamily)
VSDSDADVVRALRAGNRDAFAELVRRYQRQLFGLVLMVVRDAAGAEEVTQDAFVRAFANLHAYDDARPFYPWLATIGVRLAQNWLRRHGRMARREGASVDDGPEPERPATALRELIEGERSRELWSAVSSLPAGERTAVTLYYREDMPVNEIARTLGVTAGTIKTLLFRGRKRLRERMTTMIPSGDPTP